MDCQILAATGAEHRVNVLPKASPLQSLDYRHTSASGLDLCKRSNAPRRMFGAGRCELVSTFTMSSKSSLLDKGV